MNTQDNIRAESHKDPAQLEREIDQKRNHIEDIVAALENKLSPSEIFDRVMQVGKGSGREFAGNLGDTIKANPVPALLTAAGLMWLYAGRDRQPTRSTSSYSTTTRTSTVATGTMATGSTTGVYGETYSDSSSDGSHGKLDAAREKLGSAKDKISSAGHRVGESTRSAAGSVRDRAHGAADSVRHGASRASDGMQRMLDENPMAAGAIGIAVGALLGSLFPTTRKEDELMGETSDRIVGQAKDKAKELARTGRETVTSASREVTGSFKEGANSSKESSDDKTGDLGVAPTGEAVISTTTVSATTSTSPPRTH